MTALKTTFPMSPLVLNCAAPLLAALMAVVPALATAQAVTPDSGAILRQLQPTPFLAPVEAKTGLSVDRSTPEVQAQGEAFAVKAIRITGNRKINTATLHALVAEGEGKSLTLNQLGKLVERITDFYRSQGYPLARAIIPAQTIAGGVVEVQIIVARFGKVSLDNRSRLPDSLLLATVSPLVPGEEVEQKNLDKVLLLLSDIPGVVSSAKIRPGDTTGTSDMDIETSDGPGVYGNVSVDSYGNKYTGRARLGGTLNIVDPLNLKFSNVLSIAAITSGTRMNYGRIAYESVVNGMGSRLGASYSALRYRLGSSLAAVQANGTAQVESLYGKHPFLRNQEVNLYGQIQYDRMALRDRIDLNNTVNDRNLRSWTFGLLGDARDDVLSGGLNTWSISRTSGKVGFADTTARLPDVAIDPAQGSFNKTNVSVSRLQYLGAQSGVYAAVAGQWAGANLDSSQKMSAGGPFSVRAYDTGAVSGDTGAQATIELRHDFQLGDSGRWQAIAFLDSASVKINKNPWMTTNNHVSLNGVGVGVNWAGIDRWNARAYLARPVQTPELSGISVSTRTWLELNRGF